MGTTFTKTSQPCMHPSWNAEQTQRLVGLATKARTPAFVVKYLAMDPNTLDWVEAEEEANRYAQAWDDGAKELKDFLDTRAPVESDVAS